MLKYLWKTVAQVCTALGCSLGKHHGMEIYDAERGEHETSVLLGMLSH